MSIPNSSNINHLWGALIIEELLRQGVEYFCLSPGSRSAPLVVPLELNPAARSYVHFDERGTAFHALGYTSASRKPAVIISTSGTAAANFLPAIIEASKKKLPLIILTVDRPPELRKSGADQTIEQNGLFGEYVRWQFDLPCPDLNIKPEFVLTTVDQAVYRAFGSPKGPVHINCMFREPLSPVADGKNFSEYLSGIHAWINGNQPYTQYIRPSRDISEAGIQPVMDVLEGIKRGIIVVGKLTSEAEQQSVLNLSEQLGWPIFPDITSGLRLGCRHPNVIPYFDQLLLSKWFRFKEKTDGILHLGGRITSKRWYQYLQESQPRHYIMVLNHPLRNDPLHNVTLRVESSVQDFCQALSHQVYSKSDPGHIQWLRKLSNQVDRNIITALKDSDLNEISAARIISENIPAKSGLFLASSMPIRDMDMYANKDGLPVIVGSNRGASGIDGTMASAAGFSVGLDKPVTLMIGDLAFLHDLNSLAMVKSLTKPMTIVVLNNDGGGIFSFLPIAQFPQTFEKLFGTPHGIEFSAAAKLFGLNYVQSRSKSEFFRQYRKAVQTKNKKSTIIEIRSDRTKNYQVHQNLQNEITELIEDNYGKNKLS